MSDRPIRAAAYIRVSTKKQAKKGDSDDPSYSLELQKKRVKALIDYEDGWEQTHVFVEPGVSGKKDSRPQLDEMLRRTDEFDRIVFWKLDRLGRSTKHLLEVADKVKELNKTRTGTKLGLVSVKEKFDTETPAGRLFYTLLAAFAEFEADIILERTIGSKIERAKDGFWDARTPFGYKRTGVGLIAPDYDERKEAQVVERIYREFLAGQLRSHIALALKNNKTATQQGGVWEAKQVTRILTDPVYVGRVVREFGAERVDVAGKHKGIVDERDWKRVQNMIMSERKAPGKSRGNPSQRFLIGKGMAVCQCGGQIGVQGRTKQRYDYYYCRAQESLPGECDLPWLPRAQIDDAVVKMFMSRVARTDDAHTRSKEAAEAKIADVSRNLGSAEDGAKKEERRLKTLQLRLQDGLPLADYNEQAVEVRDRLQEHRDAAARLREELERLESHPDLPAVFKELHDRVMDPIRTVETTQALRAAIKQVFSHFEIVHVPLEPGFDDADLAGIDWPLAVDKAQLYGADSRTEAPADADIAKVIVGDRPAPPPSIADDIDAHLRAGTSPFQPAVYENRPRTPATKPPKRTVVWIIPHGYETLGASTDGQAPVSPAPVEFLWPDSAAATKLGPDHDMLALRERAADAGRENPDFSSSAFVKTRPGSPARVVSSWYSLAERSSVIPATVTSRESVFTARSPWRMTCRSRVRATRPSTAPMRASNSG